MKSYVTRFNLRESKQKVFILKHVLGTLAFWKCRIWKILHFGNVTFRFVTYWDCRILEMFNFGYIAFRKMSPFGNVALWRCRSFENVAFRKCRISEMSVSLDFLSTCTREEIDRLHFFAAVANSTPCSTTKHL